MLRRRPYVVNRSHRRHDRVGCGGDRFVIEAGSDEQILGFGAVDDRRCNRTQQDPGVFDHVVGELQQDRQVDDRDRLGCPEPGFDVDRTLIRLERRDGEAGDEFSGPKRRLADAGVQIAEIDAAGAFDGLDVDRGPECP